MPGTTVNERMTVAVCGVGELESVTLKLKELVPLLVGVPVISPVCEFKDKPGGREPESSCHV